MDDKRYYKLIVYSLLTPLFRTILSYTIIYYKTKIEYIQYRLE